MGVKDIQAAAYNDARTVHTFMHNIDPKNFYGIFKCSECNV